MKLVAVMFSVLLGCGMAMAQEQSSGTVNSMSVDPQQNQKLSGSMGTETGQPNDVTPGSHRDEALGNPSNSQISGQNNRASKNKKMPGGSPSANQNSASTNSGKAPRRTDNRDSSLEPSSRPHR